MFRFIILCLIILYIAYDRYYERLLEYMGTNSSDVFKWFCITILIIICLIPRLDQKVYNSWNYIRKMPSKTNPEYKYKYNPAYQNNFNYLNQNQGFYPPPPRNHLGAENSDLGYTNLNLDD